MVPHYRVRLHPSASPHQQEARQRKLQVRSINRLLQGIMKFCLISLASLGMISQAVALPRAGMLIVRVQIRILLC